MPDVNALRQQVVWWFARMRGAPPDHPDRLRFETWLAADPSHAAEYAAFTRLLRDLDTPTRCDMLADAMGDRLARRRQDRRQVLKGGAMAVLLAAMGGGLARGMHYRSQWSVSSSTGIGEIRDQPLPDGSSITLGAGSSMVAEFSQAERAIRLVGGEAIFDVAKDPERPFVVSSRGARITVLGTRFAVSRLDEQLRVSVDHGRVQVEGGAFWRRQRLLVTDGQVAELGEGASAADLPRYVARPSAAGFAFRTGAIPFEQAALDEVAGTLSRYRHAPVRFQSTRSRTPGPRITALVQADNVEGFLRMLPRIAPVEVHVDDASGMAVLTQR